MRQRGYNKMSLCYDFQKLTILTMLAILAVCLVGVINLVNGEVSDRPNPLRDILKNGILLEDGQVHPVLPSPGLMKMIATIDEINIIMDYCYEHAANANPVQELVDKGLVNSTAYSGKTCADVKRGYDIIPQMVAKLKTVPAY
jgi:hypothetical protein